MERKKKRKGGDNTFMAFFYFMLLFIIVVYFLMLLFGKSTMPSIETESNFSDGIGSMGGNLNHSLIMDFPSFAIRKF